MYTHPVLNRSNLAILEVHAQVALAAGGVTISGGGGE